jgi:putative transposase
MRDLLAHAGRNSSQLATAFIGITFAQEAQTATRIRRRKVVNQVRPSLPKFAAFVDFPAARWVERQRSTTALV